MPEGDIPAALSYPRILAASALGLGISLLLLLPPIVHFCSGPLGPLVGGYFAGSRFRARAGEGLLIGLGMGILAIFPLATVLFTPVLNILPIPPRAHAILSVIAVVVLCYIAILGATGAVIGGHVARQERDPSLPTRD